MSSDERNVLDRIAGSFGGSYCELDGHGYCPTCADEALPARVLEIDDSEWTAVVEINGQTAEVDISLMDQVVSGRLLLVHGGVAIGSLSKEAGT